MVLKHENAVAFGEVEFIYRDINVHNDLFAIYKNNDNQYFGYIVNVGIYYESNNLNNIISEIINEFNKVSLLYENEESVNNWISFSNIDSISNHKFHLIKSLCSIGKYSSNEVIIKDNKFSKPNKLILESKELFGLYLKYYQIGIAIRIKDKEEFDAKQLKIDKFQLCN